MGNLLFEMTNCNTQKLENEWGPMPVHFIFSLVRFMILKDQNDPNQVSKSFYVKHEGCTIKSVLVATSVKQAACIKQARSFPKRGKYIETYLKQANTRLKQTHFIIP